jgi:hypothetical protein
MRSIPTKYPEEEASFVPRTVTNKMWLPGVVVNVPKSINLPSEAAYVLTVVGAPPSIETENCPPTLYLGPESVIELPTNGNE